MHKYLFSMNLREFISFVEGIALAFVTVFTRSNLKLGISIVVIALVFNALQRWAGPLI